MNPAPTARNLGLIGCAVCQQVSRLPAGRRSGECPRCGSLITSRKVRSAARTWAYLAAATVLYFPANMLPVMHAQSPIALRDDTILSGIVFLWTGPNWPLAILVFIASIVIPLTKILVLSLLLLSIQWRRANLLVLRTRLHRIVEFIGPWSMLDVYVVAILTALVQLGTIAEVTAGPGAFAFAAVVVLTMFASRSFDTRLLWDAVEKRAPVPARARRKAVLAHE